MANDLETSGSIAAKLGTNRDRINFLIEARGIRHTRRAGLYRLYGPEAVAQIRLAHQLSELRGSRCSPHLARFKCCGG